MSQVKYYRESLWVHILSQLKFLFSSVNTGDVFGQLVQTDDLQGRVSLQLDDPISLVNIYECAHHPSAGTSYTLHLKIDSRI